MACQSIQRSLTKLHSTAPQKSQHTSSVLGHQSKKLKLQRLKNKTNKENKKHYIVNGSGPDSTHNYTNDVTENPALVTKEKMTREQLYNLFKCRFVEPVTKKSERDTD